MSFTVIIPARFGSKRLPGKPLLELKGNIQIPGVLKNVRELVEISLIEFINNKSFRKTVKEKTGKRPYTNVNLVRI